MSLESKIEAVLFWKAEPVSIKELAAFFETNEVEINTAILKLEENLVGRGLVVVKNNDQCSLYTSPEQSDVIKKITKEELSRDISRAGSEVLSLIIYRGQISKRDIDYLRGVNSGYIIRNLMVRGLIERIDTTDTRSFVYQPTFELLAHLGVTKREELPNFASVQGDLQSFMKNEVASGEENG